MMKQLRIKYIVFIICLLLTLSIIHFQSSIPVYAHLVGQPPFFKVNGEYSYLYPVPLTSLYNFDLPQDMAPASYLVNQPITFELDGNRLPAPPDIVAKTKFDWDFTDGTHAQGLKNQHTFTQIGSYIIKIYADDGTTPKPQLLESALVNVLPGKNYKLPQAKILINGVTSKDPLTDILQADFKQSLAFDGSKSSSSNSIAEYFWDFGDQKSAFGVTQSHIYPKDLSQTFVVLRVKDSRGFLADNFVEVQNLQNNNQMPSTPSASTAPVTTKKSNQLPYTLGGIAALLILIMVLRNFILNNKRR